MKKNYSARITRKTPSAFVFLIDMSGSMGEKVQFNGTLVAKSAAVAELINKTVAELVHRCKREDGYRDYLDIAVLGYGGEEVRSLLPEGNFHPVFRKPDELAYARVDTVKTFRERTLPDGNKVLSSMETKAWVKPRALGKTPMFAALQEVYKLLYEWTRRYAAMECFPPVVINISDGEATDAEEQELLAVSEKLRELKTADGNVLLFNIFIGQDPACGAVLFPSGEEQLPETPFARLLFRMSSPLPDVYHDEIAALIGTCAANCRGMSYNASLTDLVGLLNIGSLSVTRLS